MENTHQAYGFIFWLHFLVFILMLLAWLLLSWYWIVALAVALQIQYFTTGSVMSVAEFGKDEAAIPFYLQKW